MTAIELMDSRKFMALAQAMVNVWSIEDGEATATEEQRKAETLQDLLDMAQGVHTISPKHIARAKEALKAQLAPIDSAPKPKRKYTKRPKDTLEAQPKRRKAEEDGGETEEDVKKGKYKFTSKQLKEEAARIDAIQAARPSEQDVIRRAIREVIKPNYSGRQPSPDGFRHFLVDLERHGEALSTNGWMEAMKAEGVPCSLVEFGGIVINPDPKPRQIDVKVM